MQRHFGIFCPRPVSAAAMRLAPLRLPETRTRLFLACLTALFLVQPVQASDPEFPAGSEEVVTGLESQREENLRALEELAAQSGVTEQTLQSLQHDLAALQKDQQ